MTVDDGPTSDLGRNCSVPPGLSPGLPVASARHTGSPRTGFLTPSGRLDDEMDSRILVMRRRIAAHGESALAATMRATGHTIHRAPKLSASGA